MSIAGDPRSVPSPLSIFLFPQRDEVYGDMIRPLRSSAKPPTLFNVNVFERFNEHISEMFF